MGMDAITQRLSKTRPTGTVKELSDVWFVQTTEISVRLAGVAAKHPALLTMLRGAWGRALMAGASQEALQGRPCQWYPPCALSVFFVEYTTESGTRLPKPYTLTATPRGTDLILSLNVFGFANEWLIAASEAFISAVQTAIQWQDLGVAQNAKTGVFDKKTSTLDGLQDTGGNDTLSIEIMSGIDDEKGILMDTPKIIMNRLLHRAVGLSCWHDLDLSSQISILESAIDAVEIRANHLRSEMLKGWARKGRRRLTSTVQGWVSFGNISPELSSLLRLGTSCGIGRGTVRGLGQYRIHDESDVI